MLNSPSLRKTLTATIAALACAAPAQSQVSANITAKLDSLVTAPLLQKRAVGIAAAVVRGRDTLLFTAHGKADAEGDVAMPLDAMFEVGSVAKQFTAAAILQLR